MNVKSITAALLVATLTTARAGAEEPPAWMPPRPPQHVAGETMRDLGGIMTGAGTALTLGFVALFVVRWVDLVTMTGPCRRPEGPDGPSTCDFFQPSDRNTAIGLVGGAAGALAIGLPLLLIGERKMKRSKH